jgi:hypothetical protein
MAADCLLELSVLEHFVTENPGRISISLAYSLPSVSIRHRELFNLFSDNFWNARSV